MANYLGKCNIQHFQLYTICLTGYYATFIYITCMRLNSSHLFFNTIYLYLKTQFPSSIKIEKSFQVKLKNIYNVSILKVRVVEWCCWYLTFDSLYNLTAYPFHWVELLRSSGAYLLPWNIVHYLLCYISHDGLYFWSLLKPTFYW